MILNKAYRYEMEIKIGLASKKKQDLCYVSLLMRYWGSGERYEKERGRKLEGEGEPEENRKD